jgi:Ca2+-binding RTX toxin-like protein
LFVNILNFKSGPFRAIVVLSSIITVSLTFMFAGPFHTMTIVQASNDHDDSGLGISNLDKLGSRIDVITCAAVVPCDGTDDDDIMFCGIRSRAFALDGDDLVYGGGLGDQVYGGEDDDLLIAGTGKSLLDGGPNDDVLMGGLGNNLLAGGNGNDKLFNGAGTAVMFGGKGANHFDCSLSALGLARSVVMDYNPTNGDTISGPCKIVNTIGNNGDSSITLPDTGETTTTEVIPGTQIGAQ